MFSRIVPLAVLLFAWLAAGETGGPAGAAVRAQVETPAPSDQENKPEAEQPVPENPAPPAGETLTSPGRLPWEKEDARPTVLPAKRIESARELLLTYGIDDSQLANFFHHQPLGPGEEEYLYRILFRLPFFGLANVERWREKEVAIADLAEKPDAHRAKLYRLTGQVMRVERQEVLKEVAEVLEYDHYYRVTFKLDDAPYPVLICARHVPEGWPLETPLEERSECVGLFLKLGETIEELPQLVFATLRMAWLPERAAALNISDDLVWLARHGMDIGLFDAPRARNQKPLGENEGPSFYALLAALGRVDPAEFKQRARRSFELGPLLQEPQKHHGSVLMVRGNARRVQKILLGEGDRDLRERFGIDHYYQIDMFVPLGEKRIQFSKGPQDKGGPVFVDSFLITVCVREVPPEFEEGKPLDLNVRLPAVFYKNWEFPSKYVEKFGAGEWKMQPAPMLLGLAPEVLAAEKPASNPYLSAGVAIVAVVALLGVVLGLWQFGRGDRQFKAKVRDLEPKPDKVGPPQ